MKFLRVIFVFFLLFSNLYSSSVALKIGILYEKLFATKKEATIGLKLWVKQINESNYGNIEAEFYDDENKLIKDFKNNKIQILISDATLYYENKKIIDEYRDIKWIMSRSENIFTQFYLIKNSQSKIDFDNFDVKKIYYKENMAKIWFDNILLKSVKNKQTNFKLYEKIEKSKKLIFNVFFNKNDVSIISKDLYDSMSKLNPQIKSKIQIIKKSKAIFFTGIGFSRKNLDKVHSGMMKKMTDDFSNSKKNFEVISFIDIQKIFLLKDGDLNELDKFYKEYFKSKKIKK
ncbi:MAG: hypothetical protein C0625_09110 [Arcobacter sp.]|nr:MAG: hypothetical protein C0625_09110 [Arcobacter sp.]